MNIFVCDPQASFAESIAHICPEGHEMRHVSDLKQLDAAVAQVSASCVLFGPGVPVGSASEWTERTRADGAAFSAIVIAGHATTEVMRLALKAGVDDFLSAAASSEELRAALQEAIERALLRSQPGAKVVEEARGRVITVFSTKGGVGKTVVATNLAIALAKMGKSVALVDLDLQFGDVGIMLRAEPLKTMLGAAQANERLDQELLRGYLTQHSSGLNVLLAPVRPEDAESITATRIGKVLQLLVGMFEFVIVDTAASLDDVVLAALDASERIIAVTMMDVASVKNMRISLQKLRQLGYNGTRVEVLLNRADSKVFLQPDEVEKAIGSKIRYRLPSDQIVPRSVNKGLPLVMESPKCPIARVMNEAARNLVSASEVQTDVA